MDYGRLSAPLAAPLFSPAPVAVAAPLTIELRREGDLSPSGARIARLAWFELAAAATQRDLLAQILAETRTPSDLG